METLHRSSMVVQSFPHHFEDSQYAGPASHSLQMSPAAIYHQPMETQASVQAQEQVQTHAQTQQQDGMDRARAYKSRNKRPCDFCRYKKAACHLENKPPCELCVRYNKECTFVESPAKRRRPNESQNGDGGRSLKRNGSFEPRSMSVSSMHGAFANGIGDGHGLDMHQELLNWDTSIPPYHVPHMGLGGAVGGDMSAFDPMLYQDSSMRFEPFEPLSASTNMSLGNGLPSFQPHSPVDTSPSNSNTNSNSSAVPPGAQQLSFDGTSGEPSLDHQESSNAQLVGLSGEADPYLLSKYRYDQYNEASFQSIRMRKMSSGPNLTNGAIDPGLGLSGSEMPTFFTIQNNALSSKAQPPEKPEVLNKYRRDVEEMVSDEVGKRLLQLFYKYVQPYFPVLSREHGHKQEHIEGTICEPSEIPTCILAAIYGHALAFLAWDEQLCVEVYTPPSADALFRLAWLACLPMLHTPNIAVLQTLLLLVQRRPTNKHVSDTPFKWVMMTTAVSIAQALGLNRDPSDWPIPRWEIMLRKRLAWATYVQEKWLALNFGRSSHIMAEDWDVAPLTPEDFEDTDRQSADNGSADAKDGSLQFIKLCELTLIVNDILSQLFSIRAARALQGSLERTLEVAKPLRLRITEWHQQLPAGVLSAASSSLFNAKAAFSPSSEASQQPNRQPPSHLELDGNGSLQLAYITAKIELFRAMLRPRATEGTAVAVTALRSGALSAAKEVFEFLENLNARELEAFWASYSRTNFTIATSFMLLLFVTARTSADAKECLGLLHGWRSMLRIKSRSCDLLNLALLRLDGVYVAGMEKLIELSPAAAQAWAESMAHRAGEKDGKS